MKSKTVLPLIISGLFLLSGCSFDAGDTSSISSNIATSSSFISREEGEAIVKEGIENTLDKLISTDEIKLEAHDVSYIDKQRSYQAMVDVTDGIAQAGSIEPIDGSDVQIRIRAESADIALKGLQASGLSEATGEAYISDLALGYSQNGKTFIDMISGQNASLYLNESAIYGDFSEAKALFDMIEGDSRGNYKVIVADLSQYEDDIPWPLGNSLSDNDIDSLLSAFNYGFELVSSLVEYEKTPSGVVASLDIDNDLRDLLASSDIEMQISDDSCLSLSFTFFDGYLTHVLADGFLYYSDEFINDTLVSEFENSTKYSEDGYYLVTTSTSIGVEIKAQIDLGFLAGDISLPDDLDAYRPL